MPRWYVQNRGKCLKCDRNFAYQMSESRFKSVQNPSTIIKISSMTNCKSANHIPYSKAACKSMWTDKIQTLQSIFLWLIPSTVCFLLQIFLIDERCLTVSQRSSDICITFIFFDSLRIVYLLSLLPSPRPFLLRFFKNHSRVIVSNTLLRAHLRIYLSIYLSN